MNYEARAWRQDTAETPRCCSHALKRYLGLDDLYHLPEPTGALKNMPDPARNLEPGCCVDLGPGWWARELVDHIDGHDQLGAFDVHLDHLTHGR